MSLTAEQVAAYRQKYGIAVAPKKQPGFFADAVQDVKETASGIGSAFKSAFKKQTEVFDADQDPMSTGVAAVGEGARGLSRAAGEVALGAGKVLLPQNVEEGIASAVSAVVRPIMGSGAVQGLKKGVERFSSAHPKTARTVSGLLGVAELGIDAAGLGAGSAATKGARAGVSAATRKGADLLSEKVVAPVRNAAHRVAQSETLTDVKNELVPQLSGFNVDTIRAIYESPEAFEAARKAGLDRITLAGRFESKLKGRLKGLDDLGEGYEPIRSSGAQVALPPTLLADFLTSKGFRIENGAIVATRLAATRSAPDIRALQSVYDNWGGATAITAEEFLNFRKDLAELARFDQASGKTPASADLAKEMRVALNTHRDQVPGLEDLDAKFAAEKATLKTIQKEFLDKDGNLRDAAINKIANATGKGKDPLLDRIEEIIPEFGAQIRMLKALEDVEYARGQKVGTYLRSGAVLLGGVVGATAFGALPAVLAGVAVMVLTSPSMMIRFIQYAAKLSDGSGSTALQRVIGKIKSGTKLTKEEASLVSSMFKDRLMVGGFLDSMGGAAAVAATASLKDEVREGEPRISEGPAPGTPARSPAATTPATE